VALEDHLMARSPAETRSDAPKPTRRRFLPWLWGALGLAALLEFLWVASAFLAPRRRSGATGDGSAVITAGPAEIFAPGSVVAFPHGKFYLVRLDDGGFLALHRRCTHLGCTVAWSAAESRFVCPCHASIFDVRGGVLQPPAMRALDLFPVRIENGIVKVDTTRPRRRERFDPSQVTRS
jgi:cytochrome b6-f complex iron-sulfur subunit